MLNVIIKSTILYLFVILSMRLMGKRQMGELQPFEFVISIIIADMVATPLANSGIPITYGVIPTIVLLSMHSLLTFLCMKSEKARAFFSGKPSFIINKGMLNKKELKKNSMDINDVLEEVRSKEVVDINDIYYAILETNGKLSVILRPDKSPLTPKDINLKPQNKGFYYAVILDGKVHKKNLDAVNLSEDLLVNEIKRHGISDVSDVFYATVNEINELYLQTKDGVKKTMTVKADRSNV
ncbi:MAG: DUF421 domain-containing protein [Eubacteriales bacterium]